MEKNVLSSWEKIPQIPQNVSISAFAEYEGNLFAAGGSLNDSESVKLYLSKDKGSTWKEIVNVPTEISFASALIIANDKIFIAGREGKCQQKWVGAVCSCNLKEILENL